MGVNDMNDLELEKAMANFLDDEQCETASEAIYQLIRAAFTAGWRAAMGSGLKAL